jgi:hypothetical protein
MDKNLEMYPEEYYKMSFGRISQTQMHCGTVWTAIQIEQGKKSSIAIYRLKNKTNPKANSEFKIIECDGNPFQCSMIIDNNNLILIWNELDNNEWTICKAVVDTETFEIGKTESLYHSKNICNNPSASVFDGKIYIVFSEKHQKRFNINLIVNQHNEIIVKENLSGNNFDSFRPCIVNDSKDIYIAWDTYIDGKYKIIFGKYRKGSFDIIKTIANESDRFLTPKLYSMQNIVYLLGIGLREVCDDKGIFDHQAYGFVLKWENNKTNFLIDSANTENPICAADLREGLLAEKSYMGFHGLRRNPYLSFTREGEIYLLWEVMLEDEHDCQKGHLSARKYNPVNNEWGKQSFLFSGGYSYAVATETCNTKLGLAFINHNNNGMNILQQAFVSLSSKELYNIKPEKWKRWNTAAPCIIKKDRSDIIIGNSKYQMYWADTHCHSVLSPDAEGEVDELINYARDFAGLDAVCITDNDFYPFKSLTLPEWEMHNKFAEHFSEPNRFIVFPGYEYTFHRKDIPHNFNHRIIFYPESGGKIHRRIDPEALSDKQLLSHLEETPAIVYPHHVTYEITNRNTDKNVEIISSWRLYMAEADFSKKQLKSGEHFGFIGSSDNHRAAPGMGGAWTGIYASSFDANSFAEAYRNRRLIATQGFPIFVDFRAGKGFIGEETTSSEFPVISTTVRAHKKIDYLKIFRDTEEIHRETPTSPNCSFNFTDTAITAGEHFYYLEIKLEGDPSYNMAPEKNSYTRFEPYNSKYPHNLARARGVFAWTSPIWVTIS